MADELERALRKRDQELLAQSRNPRGVPPQKAGPLDLGVGLKERLAFLNQTFNPVEAIGQSMGAGERLMSGDIAAVGDMLSGVAGVAAPALVAGRAGIPAATAAMESLMGASPTQQAAADMARQFAGDESGALMLYHGSPHNFAAERLVRMPDGSTQYIVGAPDELPDVPEGAEVLQDYPLGRARLDKIGTGTGMQGYGPGLYAGDVIDTGVSYRNKLSPKTKLLAFGDQQYSSVRELARDMLGDRDPDTTEADLLLDPLSSAVFRLMKTTSLDSAIKDMREDFGDIRSPESLDEAEALFRSASPRIESSGRLYEMEIPADPEDFLDYELPANKQSQKVQDFLQDLTDRGLAKNPNQALHDAFTPGREGRIIAEEAARAGLAGNRFPATSYGSYNYVLVNENLIKIVRKYGVAGAAAMLGVSAADVEQALAQPGEGKDPVQGSSLDVDVFALR